MPRVRPTIVDREVIDMKKVFGFLVNVSMLPNIKSCTAINERMGFIHIKGKIWDY